jgi:hypothetical protein
MRAVIYQGSVDELDGHEPFRDGECVALPQAVTDVGHTSRWRPGPLVLDLSYLNPGTVIANFVKDRFPNKHGYHAALFLEFGPRNMTTGVRSIWVIDQWVGKRPARRRKAGYNVEDARRQHIAPADNAAEFYVVQV